MWASHSEKATPLRPDPELLYRTVIEALDEGVVLQDRSLAIVASNASACRILQLTPDELHGRTSFDPEWEAIHEDGRPFPGETHPAAVTLRTGVPESNVLMGVRRGKVEPTWITINARPLFRPGEREPYAVVCSFIDITHTRRLEQSLRQSEARHRALFEHSMDGILLTAPDGRILAANPAACRMLGMSEQAVVEGGRSKLVDESDPRVIAALEERRRTGGMLVEVTLRRADGTTFPAEVSSAVFTTADGEAFTSMFLRDVTERHRLERTKGELLSTVSHELRTPLTVVDGALRLFAAEVFGPVPPRAKDLLATATSNAERLSRLVDKILELTLIQSGRTDLDRSEATVDDLVVRGAELARRPLAEAECTLETQVHTSRRLHVDGERIAQVLVHLVENAVKFSPRGSRIVVRAADEGPRVRFEVRDPGAGIAAHEQSLLFQRFRQVDGSDTRAHGGTGLGLALCKAIVEAHGGSIGVTSAPGAGSTFWFDLPAGG